MVEPTADHPARDGLLLTAAAVWRDDRGFVLLVSLLILAVQAVGSLVLPLFTVPDERHHADLVAVAVDHAAEGWRSGKTRLLDEGVVALSREYRGTRTAANAAPRDGRPPLMTGQAAGNQIDNIMVKHPPLYYVVLDVTEGAVDQVWPGSFTASQEVLLYRWISALFLVPVPFLCMIVARILGGDRDTQRVAAVLPVAIPGLVLRDGALVNNDALMILTTGIAIVAALEIAQGGGRWVAFVGGAAAGLATLTKLFGWVAVPGLGLALLMSRRRGGWSNVTRSSAYAIAGLVIAGGWFWVRNLLWYGAPFVVINARDPVPGFVPDWGFWVLRIIRNTWSGFWGAGFAIPPVEDYIPVLVAATSTLLALAVIGWWRGRASLGMRWIAGCPLVGMALIGFGWQAFRYPTIGRVAGVQGRYFYVAIVGFLPLAAIGLRLVLRRPRRLAPVVTIAASVSLGWSTWVMMHQYWGEPGAAFGERLRAVAAWAPVWPSLLWAVIGVAAVMLVAVTVSSSNAPVTAEGPSGDRHE